MATLQNNNVEKYLRHFAESVLKKAKLILRLKNKIISGKLINSLKYRLEATKVGYNLIFKGAEHANFIDRGVSGKGGSFKSGKYAGRHFSGIQTFTNIAGKKVNSPFRYTNKQPPASALDKWIVRRGIAPRTKTGQFMKRKSLQFAIAGTIYKKGIESTSFFSEPMSIELAKFNTGLLKQFKIDVITHFETLQL